MISVSVTVPAVVGALSAAVSLAGFAFNGNVSAQMAASAEGDAVVFYGANLAGLATTSLMVPIENLAIGGIVSTVTGAQPSTAAPVPYLYLYAERVEVVTASTLVATIVGEASSGGSAPVGTAWLLAGNATGGPATLGTLDGSQINAGVAGGAGSVTWATASGGIGVFAGTSVPGHLTAGTITISSLTATIVESTTTIAIGSGSSVPTAPAAGGVSLSSASSVYVGAVSGGVAIATGGIVPALAGNEFAVHSAGNIYLNATGSVAVGPMAAATGCAIDVQSSTGGVGIDSMTTAQRNVWAALPPAKAGTLIFNATIGGYEYWNGSAVVPLVAAGAGWLLTGNSPAATSTLGTLDGSQINAGVAGGAGAFNLTTASGAIAIGAGTAPALTAGTLVMSASSAASLTAGAGGIGIGVAAPGSSDVAIDTTGAHTVLVGNVNAATITIGAGAATLVSVQAGGGSGAILIGTSALSTTLIMGSITGTSTTTISSGSGGIGIGVGAPGSSGTAIDTPSVGTSILSLGIARATTITLGGSASAVATASFNVQSSGALTLGGGDVANTVNLATGTGGKTVHIADAAAANIVFVGSSNTTSATTVLGGSGGIGVGVAAPGSSGTTIDSTAAGVLTLGGTNATTVNLNLGAAGTIGIGTASLNASLNVGNGAAVINSIFGSQHTTSATTLQAGTGGMTVSSTGAININSNGAGLDITVAASGTLKLGSVAGSASTQLRAGTGGLVVTNNGNAWTWPTADGTSNQALVTNGAGTLSFATVESPVNVQTFIAGGGATWTKPAGVTATSQSLVELWASGGGGGSGARSPGPTSGGAGGSGGGYSWRWFATASFGATETVTVPAGGAGGLAVTVDNTAGNTGSPGANATFGNWLQAFGTPTAGTSGGQGGQIAAGSTNGQACTGTINSQNGASGTNGAAGTSAGTSTGVCQSGASGGGITAGQAATNGGAGSGPKDLPGVAALAGVAPGGAGGSGTSATTNGGGGTSGGGGASNTAGPGGAGGTAGNYGTGGSGGGSATNGNNSGAGSSGAPAFCRVTTFL